MIEILSSFSFGITHFGIACLYFPSIGSIFYLSFSVTFLCRFHHVGFYLYIVGLGSHYFFNSRSLSKSEEIQNPQDTTIKGRRDSQLWTVPSWVLLRYRNSFLLSPALIFHLFPLFSSSNIPFPWFLMLGCNSHRILLSQSVSSFHSFKLIFHYFLSNSLFLLLGSQHVGREEFLEKGKPHVIEEFFCGSDRQSLTNTRLLSSTFCFITCLFSLLASSL